MADARALAEQQCPMCGGAGIEGSAFRCALCNGRGLVARNPLDRSGRILEFVLKQREQIAALARVGDTPQETQR